MSTRKTLMKESIYIETSVVSYYVSKPSRDIIVLALHQITSEWWTKAVKRFDVYISSVHNIDYLVTWNCVHLANGEIIKKLLKINEKLSIKTPVICTPEELMEV